MRTSSHEPSGSAMARRSTRATVPLVVVAWTAVLLLAAGCAGGDLARRAAEDAQRKALIAEYQVDEAVAADPGLTGQALADTATAAIERGRVTSTTVTGSGVELTLEFNGYATSGGGWFVDTADRRLCVLLTVTPDEDPPTRLEDAECSSDLPPGTREIDLD